MDAMVNFFICFSRYMEQNNCKASFLDPLVPESREAVLISFPHPLPTITLLIGVRVGETEGCFALAKGHP